jgi:hypothetical protein
MGNYPEESIQHAEHGEGLKSRIMQIIGSEIYVLHGKCLSNLNYNRNTNVSLKLHELYYNAEP